MKIGTVLHPFGEKHPSGLGKCIFKIVKNLVEVFSENSYTIYLKQKTEKDPEIKGTNWKSIILNSKYLYLSGGKNLDNKQDVHVFFNPVIPFFFWPKKSVVVVFDNSYMEMETKGFNAWLKKWFMFSMHYVSLRKATQVVAVSEDTARTTEKYFGVPVSKIKIVYIGFMEHALTQEPVDVPDQFFLFAGVLKERKNPLGAIRGFATIAKDFPEVKLLIAGKKNDYYESVLAGTVKELNLEDRIQFLDYVSNEKLSFLYSKAMALVFPSLYDGFGMPILEAFSAGLPVIASNYGGPAEAAGDCAVLIDPNNPEDIGRGMQKVLEDEKFREVLKEKGQERAKLFTWENTAKGLVQICKEIIF